MQTKLEANKIFDARRNIVISLRFVEDFRKLNFIDYTLRSSVRDIVGFQIYIIECIERKCAVDDLLGFSL